MNDEDIRFEDAQIKLRNLVAEFNKKIGRECGDSIPTDCNPFYYSTEVLFTEGNYPYTLVLPLHNKIYIRLDFKEEDSITKSQINNIKVEVREGCHIIIMGEKMLGAQHNMFFSVDDDAVHAVNSVPCTYLDVYKRDDGVTMAKFGREVVLPFDIELKDIKRHNMWNPRKRDKPSLFASGNIVLEILKPEKKLIRQEPIILY